MDTRLLEILACPICKGPLKFQRDAQVLVCRLDRLAYPIRDDVPVMLEEEARQLSADDPLTENLVSANLIGEEFVGATLRLYADAGSQQEIRLLTGYGARSSGITAASQRVVLSWNTSDAYVLPE